jgi:kynurenine formamidase
MNIPTPQELHEYMHKHRNWGRWGDDDQCGAINLITPEKVVASAALVKCGKSISLSRPLPKMAASNNPNPAQHWIRTYYHDHGGASVDYIATNYHGYSTTHLDALCHVWGPDGMYNGGQPNTVRHGGARWGPVDRWAAGIMTRGVLIDVPRFRGEPYVTLEKPVMGAEIEEIAKSEGVTLEPGDALVVYSGREDHDQANPLWGSVGAERPGLHPSCVVPIRERDVAMVVWDMQDATAPEYTGVSVHAGIWAYGLALIDNALLTPLAQACAAEGRYEFLLYVSPLLVLGGTGSPVNPIAVL